MGSNLNFISSWGLRGVNLYGNLHPHSENHDLSSVRFERYCFVGSWNFADSSASKILVFFWELLEHYHWHHYDRTGSLLRYFFVLPR